MYGQEQNSGSYPGTRSSWYKTISGNNFAAANILYELTLGTFWQTTKLGEGDGGVIYHAHWRGLDVCLQPPPTPPHTLAMCHTQTHEERASKIACAAT